MKKLSLLFFLAFISLKASGQSYSVIQNGTYDTEFNSPTFYGMSSNGLAPIALPFNFNFFGNTYSSCYVGENGFIAFDTDGSGLCCGQPLPVTQEPNNLIAVAWTNHTLSSVGYEVFGSAPFRRVVLTLDLQEGCTDYYGQVKLFESTNVIEIHTQQWAASANPCANTTQGIENEDGTEAIIVPGRNYNTTWSVDVSDEDFVAFIPELTYIVSHDDDYIFDFVAPNDVTVEDNQPVSVPIGFNFDFFGGRYSSCFLADDGFLSFGANATGGCCEGQNLPDQSSPNNLIAAAWMNSEGDNCCSGGNTYNVFSYETLGSFPNRRFVVTFEMDEECSGAYYYGQVKLLESSNIIEIHTSLYSDAETPCENVTQGIENAGGTQAFYYNGRNANTNWFVPCCEEDVVRFVPATSLPDADAGVSYIYQDELCEGDHLMKVLISNYSGEPLDSVEVHWTWQGIPQATVETHFTIPVGGLYYPVELDTQTLVFGQNYTMKAWTSLPNGVPDELTSNDTMTATISAALEGNYTIGGSSPDYATLTDAINALISNGICDSVTMLVRPGTYNVHVSIPFITGTFDEKIVFKAENGDSSSVVVQYNALSLAENYVIRFGGAQNIIWEKMTLNALNTSFGRVIEMNAGNNNIIRHCAINGINTSSTSINLACITSGTLCNGNQFLNNTIQFGSYGLYHQSLSSDNSENIGINGNKFSQFSFRGISTTYTKGIQIHRNTIESTKSNAMGIQLHTDIDSLSISGNKLLLTAGSYGMQLTNINVSGGVAASIFNNMINVPNTSATPIGLGILNCYHTDVCHNTVRLTSNNTLAYAFYQSGGSTDSVYNNIFTNTGGGPVIYSNISQPNAYDYNDYYVTGTQFGSYVATTNNAQNLADWRILKGDEDNSMSINPLYVSSTNLHTQQSLLNARGTALLSTTTDIDGEIRHTTKPDIGADEFTPGATDAGITHLLSPAMVCEGDQIVEVVLSNLGTDYLTDVTVNWTINGVAQAPLLYSQTLDPEGDTAHIVLGSYVFTDQPDELKIWTSMPNNDVDQQLSNDTLKYIYRLPLNGTYTIGGSNPSFTSMANAIVAMKTYTICGPVVFKFRNGTYTGQIEIDSIVGASALNTITFESESGDSSTVELSATGLITSKNYLIKVEKADYLTFRNMRFKTSANVSFNQIFIFQNGANHITLEGNSFVGRLNTLQGHLIFINGANRNEYYTIRNNYFRHGTAAIAASGMNHPNRSADLVIENNTFRNQRNFAIDIINQKNFIIKDNTILKDVANVVGSPILAMDIDQVHGSNVIYGNTTTLSTGGNGIDVNSANNQIDDQERTLIYNNMIYTNNGIGLRVWNSERTGVFHNSVNSTGTLLANYAFEVVSGDSIDIRNNIFVANTGRAFSGTLSNPTNTISNYNDLVTSGAQLGFWNNTSYANLTTWKVATGFDANSMQINPQFVSATNLHVLADTLDAAGTPAGITLDIDEQPRNALTPDIGADEIGTNNNDIGVLALLPAMPFARGNQDIKAVIRNYGANIVTSLTVQWKFNGTTQTSFNYTGSIPTLGQDTVTLGNVELSLATPYDFKAWTSQPNMTTDFYNTNDTVEVLDQYAAVSGIVTVGGTNPEVTTIQNAIVALTLGGVIDSVHFKIRPGTYIETISIPHHEMLTCNTPVIFESETGDAEDVLWKHVILTSQPLTLTGADGLSFQNITFQTTSINHQVVVINNQSNCNTFHGCRFIGIDEASSSSARSLIYSSSGTDIDNAFYNNHFINGSYGIYWQGTAQESGTIIEGNQFENQHYRAIYVVKQTAPSVSKNRIESNTEASTAYIGIYLIDCDNQMIAAGNEIRLSYGDGIVNSSSAGTSTFPGLIYNNFILSGLTSTSYGINIASSPYQRVYHNTIRMTGSNVSTYGLYISSSLNCHVVNNIISNQAGGAAIRLSNETDLAISNYNDLLANGPDLIYTNLGLYDDLEMWQGTGKDLNSISEDPQFSGNSSVHVTSAFLNGTATPLPQVTIDIDGDVRDGIMPDIGADEFNLFPDDVGIISISYPSQPFPSGINTVYIKFSNNGEDTLVTMQVNWEVDGIEQPPYSWTGLLPSGSTYDSLDIGQYNFTPYESHTIRVTVSLPNGMPDGLASNDMLEIEDLYPGLLGIFTIGGNTPDFDSIGQAITALNLGGAAGPVTFNIRPGTYLETINLNDYPGADCTRPVIFQSENGDSSSVTITNLGLDDNIITLNGTDGVIFRHLTLRSVNPAFRNVIFYSNEAHCNQFLNNKIEGYVGSNSGASHSVIWSSSGLDTANVFRNNLIKNGSYGFYLQGSATGNSNTLIENNHAELNSNYAIYADDEAGIQIVNNTFLPGSAATRGIQLDACNGAISITGNKIRLIDATYGISLVNCNATTGSHGITANNFVSIGGNSSAFAIYLNSSDFQDIYHNNLHVHSTTTSTTNTAAIYLTGNSSLDVRNNIFINSSPGWSVYASSNTSFTSDYNNLYAEGVNLANLNGVNRIDLNAWQTSSGLDAASISINPQYMSDTDLHVTSILLNGAGQNIPNVSVDIDGQVRNNPPDIGADEFNPSIADDAGIFMFNGPNAPFAHGAQSIFVTLKNFGYDTLESVNIRWLVNGIEQAPFAWTGSLPSTQCDTVDIGQFSFAEYSDHDLLFWTELPNGTPDSTHVNDTMAVNNKYPALSGTYTVGGVLPDFNLFIHLQDALNTGGVLGNVFFDIRPGTYSTQLLIKNFPRNNYAHEVTFQSESGDSTDVIILRDFTASTDNNYTIRFKGAHQVNFEHLTLKSTKGRIVDIIDGSSQISIRHCHLTGFQPTNHTGTHHLIYSNTTSEDSITIHQNRFEYGEYGIYMTSSSGDPEKDAVVTGNYFYNCLTASVFMRYQSGLLFTDNSVFNNVKSHDAIELSVCPNTKAVSRNDIRLLAGGSYGLSLYKVDGVSGTRASVSNNYVSVSGSVHTCYGIYQEDAKQVDFNYNTIRMENTGAGSIAFVDNSSYTQIHVRNCNFANYSGGRTIQNSWVGGYQTNTIDYCNLYTTGSILAYVFNEYADLAALQAASSQFDHSVSVEPLFVDGGPDVQQVALNNAATPIAGITTDIIGDPRHPSTPDIGAREFTVLAHDIGAKLLQTPQTYCGFGSTEDVIVRIQNYGASAETGFNVAYSIDGSEWKIENVGALSVLPGGILDYTFSTTEDLSIVGNYSFSIYTDLESDLDVSNDTIWNINVEHIPALTTPVSNMIPSNGTTGLEKNVSLSWSPALNATKYDVYVWIDGNTPPVTPQVSNISQINTLFSNLIYGETYNWKVVAKNVCDQMTTSAVQQFSIREIPDLIVDTIIAPPVAFSGQMIEIEWQVKNTGVGGTLSQTWSDAVYLSTDATLNISYDTYIGAVQNLTSLDVQESYTQTSTFPIPDGFSGNYYVFVYSDRWSNLTESNNNNNWERTPGLTEIQLTPIPDLKVEMIAIPNSTFSGQTITLQYEVKNIGLAATTVSSWKDRVIFSADPFNYAAGTVITTLLHQGNLEPDSSYTRNVNIPIPQGIFGNRYVYVVTDWFGDVFENAAENNNVGRSDTMEVFLTPPPDLIITEINFPDTVHNNEVVSINYILENQGGSNITVDDWRDAIYYSPSPIYNTNFLLTAGSDYNYGPMVPFDPQINATVLQIPLTLAGEQYLYIFADKDEKVFEFTYESNNIKRTTSSFFVANPDLRPVSVSYANSVTAGDPVTVSWNLINDGPGHILQRNVKTKIYISDQPAFDEGSDILVSSFSTSIFELRSGDTSSFSRSISIPDGLSGIHYIHVFADGDRTVFENNQESDNSATGSGIMISLPPYPDLVSREISTPDTITAGQVFTLSYEAFNMGSAAAEKNSTDSIFLSFSPVWNPTTNVRLGRFAGITALTAGDSQLVSIPLFISQNQNSNVYYIYIKSDATSEVFEHSGESNNITRSDAVFIRPPLPLDILPEDISLIPDTVYSGTNLNITYAITNQGERDAFGIGWLDGGYLSTDTIFQPGLDVRFLVKNLTTAVVPAGQSVNQSASGIVPAGLSGDFYVFIRSDDYNALGDVNYANNVSVMRQGGLPRKLHIKLSPSPDLIIEGFNASVDVFSGQPLEIELTTGNAGTGTAFQWKTKIYLSTDDQINNTDLLLTTEITEFMLDTGESHTTNFNVNIPGYASGNYILIAQTDAANQLFEFNGENNNIQTRVVTVTLPPPSDLIVTAIALPDSAYAGDTATVSWESHNAGTFPVNGNYREIVYFSIDSLLDVDDRVFGILDENDYIAPGYSISRTFNAPLNGLTNLDYYALVQTDAQSNIHEISDDNNIGVSETPINISIEQLHLDSLTPDILVDGKENYFRLEIPFSVAGENLQISLDGDSLASFNEIYLKYGSVPTAADFDATHLFAFQPDQELIFEELEGGTYYVMVRGLTPVGNSQDITLLARIVDFELLSVRPNRLTRQSQSTIELFGTQMDTLRNVYLVRDSTIRILADSVYRVNSQRAYATFTIDSIPFYGFPEVPLGFYDVQAERWDGKLAELLNGVEIIEQGTGPSLQFVMDHPAEVSRFNRPMKITIFMSNSGDADIVGENFVFEAPWGNQMAFTLDELIHGNSSTSLIIPIQGAFGPPGILSPKGNNVIEVYSYSAPHPTFALTPVNE